MRGQKTPPARIPGGGGHLCFAQEAFPRPCLEPPLPTSAKMKGLQSARSIKKHPGWAAAAGLPGPENSRACPRTACWSSGEKAAGPRKPLKEKPPWSVARWLG